MWATLIKELEVARQADSDISDCLVGAEIDLFVLDRASETFDEDVVAPAAAAIHADRDLAPAQDIQKRGAGELTALIVLKISGVPKRFRASSSAETQQSLVSVGDTRHVSTLRLAQ